MISIGFAARLFEVFSIAKASLTLRPRIRSITSLAFCGEPLMYFATARAFIAYFPPGAFFTVLSDFSGCPLNCRVGANSPSLWPTMFS